MKYFFILLSGLSLISCSTSPTLKSELVAYSTQSDSALYYYRLGWHEIMDLGEYTGAEISYRKALEFDPDFLVGQSVLGRLTRNLEERKNIYGNIETRKGEIQGDERLILDVYNSLVRYTNLRAEGSGNADKAKDEAMLLGEKNLAKIVHRYPSEIYLKSEYIEVLHSLYGAQSSLDSLNALCTPEQKLNPFILGYSAILKAELGNYDQALVDAKELGVIMDGMKVAKPDAILADIYFKSGDLPKAKFHADRANKTDPGNLDASRLKVTIDRAIDDTEIQ